MQVKLVVAMMFAVIMIVAGMPAGGRGADAPVEWTKIVIKEAFISRQTSIDFRDPNSAAEFGWQVKRGGAFAARGGSLYATMYVPFGRPEPLRLFLVERDVFSDDIVSGVDLEQGKSRYVLNANGDFVVLERTPFYPDGRSGGDETPEKAAVVAGDMRGSVSFLDGDYTDCVKLPDGPVALLLIASSPSLSVDIPSGGDVVLHPRKKSINTVTMAVSEKGGDTVRLRGAVAGRRIDYRVFARRGKADAALLMDLAVKHVASQEGHGSIFACKDIARALLSLDRETTLKKCGAPAGADDARECVCREVRAESKAAGGRK